jgi:hypothetical protein
MHPLDCLRQELRKYESALNHATKDFQAGKIDYFAFHGYETNLKPIISNYNFAINLLKDHDNG